MTQHQDDALPPVTQARPPQRAGQTGEAAGPSRSANPARQGLGAYMAITLATGDRCPQPHDNPKAELTGAQANLRHSSQPEAD